MADMRKRCTTLALLAVVALALAARSAGFEWAFVGGDDVVFTIGDPYYHLRRAWVTFLDFPHLLEFDPYLAFPDGWPVPMPPLWTWTLAGVARGFGSSQAVFEHVAAWLPAFVGALTVLPVYAVTRRFAGPATALAAGTLLALLPVHLSYSSVGNPDHHALESLLGAVLLWLYVLGLERARVGRALLAVHAGLVAARVAMLLTWSGSLLHLGIGEAALVLAAVLAGDRRRLALTGAGDLLAAAAIAPFAMRAVAVGAPPFSSVELTLLHPLFYLCAGGVALAAAGLEQLAPARRAPARLLRVAAIGAVVALALLAVPSVRDGIVQAQAMLTKGNVWHARAAEQQPLVRTRPALDASVGIEALGLFVFLVPFAPLAVLGAARDPARRAPALFLGAWTALAGGLALTQLRLCVDYAPAAAAVFALGLREGGVRLSRALGHRPRTAALLTAALAAALLAPGLGDLARAARGSWGALAGPGAPGDRALATPAGTLMRFARAVRAATPETAGFLGDGVPAYGVIVFPGIGHTFLYEARRPTPAGNFGPYANAERFEAARTFFALEDEKAAVERAEELRSPYVVTNLAMGEGPRTLLHRLHVDDGRAAKGLPLWERFRLVTEGPAGGTPLAQALGRRSLPSAVPYKLWEIVEGARLRVAARPGAAVTASVVVGTPIGRRFEVRAEATADGEGVATLRVPYATLTSAPARPETPWRVASEGRAVAVALDEEQVRTGATVDVDLGGP